MATLRGWYQNGTITREELVRALGPGALVRVLHADVTSSTAANVYKGSYNSRSFDPNAYAEALRDPTRQLPVPLEGLSVGYLRKVRNALDSANRIAPRSGHVGDETFDDQQSLAALSSGLPLRQIADSRSRAYPVAPLPGEAGRIRYPDRTFAFLRPDGEIDPTMTDSPIIFQSVVAENMPGEGRGGLRWPNGGEREALFDIAYRRPGAIIIATPKEGRGAGTVWWTVAGGSLVRMDANSMSQAVYEGTYRAYAAASNTLVSQFTTG